MKKGKHILPLFLLVLFSVYYADVSLFYHAHIVQGVTIVHSHFYGKGHVDQHKHSSHELALIDALSLIETAAILLAIGGLLTLTTPSFLLIPYYRNHSTGCELHARFLRGPPVLPLG